MTQCRADERGGGGEGMKTIYKITVGQEKNGENIWSKFSNIVKGKNLLKFSE